MHQTYTIFEVEIDQIDIFVISHLAFPYLYFFCLIYVGLIIIAKRLEWRMRIVLKPTSGRRVISIRVSSRCGSGDYFDDNNSLTRGWSWEDGNEAGPWGRSWPGLAQLAQPLSPAGAHLPTLSPRRVVVSQSWFSHFSFHSSSPVLGLSQWERLVLFIRLAVVGATLSAHSCPVGLSNCHSTPGASFFLVDKLDLSLLVSYSCLPYCRYERS